MPFYHWHHHDAMCVRGRLLTSGPPGRRQALAAVGAALLPLLLGRKSFCQGACDNGRSGSARVSEAAVVRREQ